MMQDEITKVCDEGRLIGCLVRNFAVSGQTWGLVQSLEISNGMLILHAGRKEDFGHEPFESSMPINHAKIYEDSEATFISVGAPAEYREWKFFHNN